MQSWLAARQRHRVQPGDARTSPSSVTTMRAASLWSMTCTSVISSERSIAPRSACRPPRGSLNRGQREGDTRDESRAAQLSEGSGRPSL